MAQFNFGILNNFDHTVHEWKAYKSRLRQWFIANDISEKNDATGSRRRAILLSALTDGTYQLTADLALPKQLEEVPFEDILELLDAHFSPKKCGFGERYAFYAATQQASETHAQWAARLRGLTKHCKFANVEEALRDRFVMGMSAGPERDKLFAKDTDTLTLAKAVELAQSIRCARAGASASTTASPSTQQEHVVFKVQGTSTAPEKEPVKEKCSVCGRNNHPSSQCRFANFTCRKCNKKGHLRRVCKVKRVVSDDVGEEDDDGEFLHNIMSERGEPMTEIVLVNGSQMRFEIDSGSAVTVISEDCCNRHFSSLPLLPPKKKLFTYTGTSIVCLGIIRVPITYRLSTHTLDVYVVRSEGPPLLGRDFLSLFKLKLAPCNFINNEANTVANLHSRFKDVFSDKLGKFTKFEVKLRLKDDAKPMFFKPRPIAFALRDKVDKEIVRLVNLGILQQVDHSEYASPVVPVLKRNGSVRLCADYSVTINKQLVVEQYPLPTVHELFSKLHGGQQFSKLDLSMAYNQFVLDKDSQKITCINTHRGLFQYTRMVFGLTSAPSILQRAMENILSGMDGVLCLLDDVLVTADGPGLHLQRLTAVLQRLQDAGLTLQKEKCEFFKNEINYLGYVINKDGLKKSSDKVIAIKESPMPTDVGKLQSFLGLVNYYRNFVPRASEILSPLYDLLRKGVNWNWTDECQKAFVEIKKQLTSDQVLAHFDPNAKIILTVDASPNGLGAILSQIDKDGCERPISFASRTLNTAEKRYSQLIQKEATAIIFGVRRFHQYLYGKSDPFILRTDHKPLISIFGPYKGIPEVSANRLQRYALFLSAYNYKIEYVRSENNCADYLSRASLPDAESAGDGPQSRAATTTADIEPGGGECGGTQHAAAAAAPIDRASYVHFVIDGHMPVTLDELRRETSRDISLLKVIDFISKGWPRSMADIKLKPFHACKNQLSYEEGCVMRGHKVVLPESLKIKILNELHISHLGIVKTKAEARSRFWFPGIDNEIENMINSCSVCIHLRPTPPRAPLAPWQYPPQPFHRLHIDFLGPIDNKHYLIVVDAYTKWVEVYDMCGTTTSSATVEKLCEFVSRFGLPNTIVSDNGTAFTSHDFKRFCEINGINHVTSPAYSPASNGQAESFVKIAKKGIKSCILSSQSQKESRVRLLRYLFDYRNSIHSVTGFSPAQLVFGRKLRSRLDMLSPKPLSPSDTSLDTSVKSKQCLQSKYNGGKNDQTFKCGNEVLYKKFLNKDKFTWCRGTITDKIGKVVYLINDHLTGSVVKKHKNQIVLYKGYANSQQSWDISELDNSVDDTSSRSTSPSLQPTLQVDSAGEEIQGASTTNGSSPPPPVASQHPDRVLRDIPRVNYRSLALGK